jgi:hypothetical protein
MVGSERDSWLSLVPCAVLCCALRVGVLVVLFLFVCAFSHSSMLSFVLCFLETFTLVYPLTVFGINAACCLLVRTNSFSSSSFYRFPFRPVPLCFFLCMHKRCLVETDFEFEFEL